MDHQTEKTALVTGGTSGVGLSLVKGLLKQRYRVFFVGSSTAKGKSLEQEFHSLYPHKATFIALDLSNLQSVDRFAKVFVTTHHRLDILVNVAGVLLPERTVTSEGLEKTFAIGYMAPFILSQRLSSLLAKTQGARIVNVAAKAKSLLPIQLNFEDLQSTQKYNGFKVSLATVHAHAVLTEIWAQRMGALGITVNAFDPGMVRSSMSRHMPLWFRLIAKAISPFMTKDSPNGIFVCTAPDLAHVTGQLFENQIPITLSFEQSYKKTLWIKTLEILENLNIKINESTQL